MKFKIWLEGRGLSQSLPGLFPGADIKERPMQQPRASIEYAYGVTVPEDQDLNQAAKRARRAGWQVTKRIPQLNYLELHPLVEINVPRFGYHASPASRQEDVMRNGLQVGSLETQRYSPESSMSVFSSHSIGKIFLAKSPELAEEWAYHLGDPSHFGNIKEPWIIYRIDLSGVDHAYKDTAQTISKNSFYIERDISPHQIEPIKTVELE